MKTLSVESLYKKDVDFSNSIGIEVHPVVMCGVDGLREIQKIAKEEFGDFTLPSSQHKDLKKVVEQWSKKFKILKIFRREDRWQ